MHFVLMQALGDNLISLSLLQQAEGKIDIIGTRLTLEVAKLLGLEEKFNIHVLFDDVAAFYNVKTAGISQALQELRVFREYVKRHNLAELVFEKEDVRAKVLTFYLAEYHAGRANCQVYLNRKSLFEKTTGFPMMLKPALRPTAPVRTVLINPLARVRERDIGDADLEAILHVLKRHEVIIQLVDHTGRFERYRDRVDTYFAHTTLSDAKELISGCDFFIGTDSFLIHLAYYCEKAFFIVFNYEYFDFLPPGCECIDNYVITDRVRDKEDAYYRKFRALGVVE